MAEHRIIITEDSIAAPTISLVGGGVIGAVVTCPADAFGSGKAFPNDTAPAATAAAVGTPKYITNRSDLPAETTLGLGATYNSEKNTIDAVLDAIYAQGRGLGVWVVPVAIGTTVGSADIVTQLRAAIKKFGGLSPKPKILICPNALSIITTNLIDTGLVTESQNVKGITVLDPPSTLNPTAPNYNTLSDGDGRAYVVYPGVKASGNVNHFASGYIAGVIAANDARRGFWTSPSNRVINGIVGTQADISYGFSGSDAVLLNTGHVATIINDGGWRSWGNESYGAPANYNFLPVRRVADAIGESIDKGLRWAMSENISRNIFEQVAQSVNGFLGDLKAKQAIVDGFCYPDPDANTKASIKGGEATILVDWTPYYPLQTLNVTIQLTDKYLVQILA